MLDVYQRLERLRGSYNGSVLITGRTGTGKELVADEIQRGSSERPYTRVGGLLDLAEAEFLPRCLDGGISYLKELERSRIKNILDDTLLRRGGTLIDVALSLGISIKGLRNKMRRYGLYDIYVDRFRRRRKRAANE